MEPKTELRKQVEKQIKDADWAKILAKAKEKKEEFKSVNLSDDGAIHIAINELYPDFKFNAGKTQGKEIKGRLVSKSKPRLVDTKNVKGMPVRDVFIATQDMGVLGATLWGKEVVELFKGVEHGDAIQAKDVKIVAQGGEVSLKFFGNSEVEKIDDKDVPAMRDLLKPVHVSEVKVSEVGIIDAIVIQTNTVKYECCPMCDGKLSEVEDTYHCKSHGQVIPKHKEATDALLDSPGGVVSVMVFPETIGDALPPQQFDALSLVCRVYDSNHYNREKAGRDGAPTDVLMNQFPRNMRVTVYSYEATPAAGKPVAATKKESAPVNVEDIEDAA